VPNPDHARVTCVSDQRNGHLRLASDPPLALLRAASGESEDPADEPLPAGTPRPALTSISVRRSGQTLIATTSLALSGRVLSGTASRTDGDRDRAIALATLDALRPLLPDAVEIESAQVIAIPGRKVALTVVEFPDEAHQYQVLVGSALVRGDLEDALARSVLSALNRRLDTEE